MRHAFRFAVAFVILLAPMHAEARIEQFDYPSIKEDFCGAHIGAQYCKCAFHGQQCKGAGMSSGEASKKVADGFQKFVTSRIETFALSCMKNGGIWSVLRTHCEYCEDGEVRDDGVCKKPGDVRPIEEQYNLPKDVPKEGGPSAMAYVDSAEGEFFVYSPGRGKWIGPVRGGLQLYEGDTLYTTEKGRARLRFGTHGYILMERSRMRIPVAAKKERTLLERGAVFVWRTLQRLATNEPYPDDLETAHSVAGSRGTRFMVEAGEEGTTYAVQEGLVQVRSKVGASTLDVKAGESASATAAGIAPAPHDWAALAAKHGFEEGDVVESDVTLRQFPQIDPDAVNPPEAAYTGDLVGKALEKAEKPGGNRWWLWPLALAGVAGGAWYVRKKRTPMKTK